MNFNGFVVFDEIWLYGLSIIFGIIIILAWMSTKVDCDFRNVRTIILQANSQRIQNYENNSQPNIIHIEEINPINPDSLDPFHSSDHINTNQENVQDNLTNLVFEESINKDSYDLSLPTTSNVKPNNDLSNSKASFFRSKKASLLKIRIKYLDDREKLVFGDFKQTISLFKRNNFLEEQSQELNIRLIYNGQELKEDDKTLEQYGLMNNCTVHCLITQPRQHLQLQSTQQSSITANSSDRSDIEISNLMFPLFGALLTVIWYCRVCYRHYFNVITTFALIGMTIVYFIACITCFNFGSNFYSINHHQTHLHRNRHNQSTRISNSGNTRISLTSTFSSF